MARIKTISHKEAKGEVKKVYDMFVENIGVIPKPMEMYSVSQELFDAQMQRIRYLSNHPKLSFSLLAYIRYLIAFDLEYTFCINLNKHVLKKLGATENDIKKAEKDPSKALLEENECAMLDFVVRAVKAPKSINDEDIQRLSKYGWEDRDMADALAQGVNMIDHAIMMEVFKIDQSCSVE